MINSLLLLGIILSLGFLLGKLAHNFKVTAIVGYIIVGIILGPSFLSLLKLSSGTEHLLVNLTLGMVAFVIGLRLTFNLMKKLGKPNVFITLGESLGAFLIVTIGVYLLTKDLPIALLLGSLAPATAPAGTLAVIQEHRSRGPLTNNLLAIVGLDDALAVMIFVFAIAAAKVLLGGAISAIHLILTPFIEIGGAIILGIVVGVLLTFVLKAITERDDIFVACLTGILISTGIAELFNFSLILTCLVFGITLVNLLPKMEKTGQEVMERILPPIYIVFFVVAGAELKINLLTKMGLLGLVYILCRVIGKFTGASITSRISGTKKEIQKYLGFALFSQAGVAVGLAYLVSVELAPLGPAGKELGSLAIATILATTVIFEVIGPLGVKYAISEAGEVRE